MSLLCVIDQRRATAPTTKPTPTLVIRPTTFRRSCNRPARRAGTSRDRKLASTSFSLSLHCHPFSHTSCAAVGGGSSDRDDDDDMARHIIADDDVRPFSPQLKLQTSR